MPDVKVKICGITRAQDAAAAAELGADYLGTILSPGFSRSVEPSVAATFRPPGAVRMVGVLVDAPGAELLTLARTAGVDILQLHGNEPPETLRTLREEGPWLLWKAVRVRTGADVREALTRYADVADALLLEGWHDGPGGGVGAALPQDAVVPVRKEFTGRLELVVAGGLRPENVAGVVRRLRPHVVDVSSGVETTVGVKSRSKVGDFIGNARRSAGSTR